MLERMIERKRNEWYASTDCTATEVVQYIERRGDLRDAQIEAIRTYLFLKIAAGNRSLHDLTTSGFFNSLDLDALAVPVAVRAALASDPALAALYEFASAKDAAGHPLSEKVCHSIVDAPSSVDARNFFSRFFQEKSYTEYLFHLPMGAGKTYLMAAFIYLDLYYAMMEPGNPAFAHNFVVLAPSGLKSSILPSLKNMQKFHSEWVLPEPSASQVRRMLKFEILDEQKSAAKSNRAKNPNVRKVALHQGEPDLMGLVLVTNAEKVILDRMKKDSGQTCLFQETEDDRERQANELRNRIGKLPHLAVFLDEVHHAADEDIKLRMVVNRWMEREQATVNQVVGFSGTPYLSRPETIPVTDGAGIKNTQIPTVVYSYRLVDGIGNFLKRPVVRLAEAGMESLDIVEHGVREFLDRFKDLFYDGKYCAKLAIYCGGSIEKLEEKIYPLVERIVRDYGMSPEEAILKYHGGNSKYPMPLGSQLEFASLDTEFSKKRIVLLVQIGKEGWDCRSLTGVILAQKGDCPQNMVLQTSCRCLRQVVPHEEETALIYLNAENGKKLNAQLRQQHHITVEEFQRGGGTHGVQLRRYNRMAHLHLPDISFRQMEIEYTLERSRKPKDIGAEILKAVTEDALRNGTFLSQDFEGNVFQEDSMAYGLQEIEPAHFLHWLTLIAKESFGTLDFRELLAYQEELGQVYRSVTQERDGMRFFSAEYRQSVIRSNIRKAFCEEWQYQTKTELLPQTASLLNVTNFTDCVETTHAERYYPDQDAAARIVHSDGGAWELPDGMEEAVRALRDAGMESEAQAYLQKVAPHPQKDRSFHYLPYHFDSGFEREFLAQALPLAEVAEWNLELYYNGDRELTNFRIKCYEKSSEGDWRYIGVYTPDFLILQRRKGHCADQDEILRAVIVETKGRLYGSEEGFKKRRKYMETAFRQHNPNFDYLYLEDSMPPGERKRNLRTKLREFFSDEKQ